MGASTKKDRRYKVRSEYCGSPHVMLVLRFCGTWIGSASDDAVGAEVIEVMRKAHDTARMALHGEPTNDLNNAMHGYMTCALWASTEEPDDEDVDLSSYIRSDTQISDIDGKTRDAMREVVAAFVAANPSEVAVYIATRKPEGVFTSWEGLGHDLWLDQNGHGGGFMDHDEVPDATRRHLCHHASRVGYTELYMGDDGKVYA